ncbi:uncharacterized protein LOC113798701 [Dermatophagoides pteronyssinus]|uniref:uncharacterized protein LOC113798701 n=1 Tax=Dermatophagoides pteronyssinus TaxID=6956 RepID=UPI003F660E13
MLSAQQQQQQQQQSNLGPTKQTTGTITKILDNFGFIDDSVFFPLSVVKGGASQVKVGDKVFFECTYSKNLPFNWNATIVQPIHHHQQSSQTQQQQPSPSQQSQHSLHQTSQSYQQHSQSSSSLSLQQQQQQSLHSVAPSHPSYNPTQISSSSSSPSLQSNLNNNPSAQQTNMYHSHNLTHPQQQQQQQQQQHMQSANHPLSGGQLGYPSAVAGHLGHQYHHPQQQQQQLSSLNSGQKSLPYGTQSPLSQSSQVYNPTVGYHPTATSGGLPSSQSTGSTNNSTVAAAAAAAAAATVSPVDLAKAAAAVAQLSQYCTTTTPIANNSTVGQQSQQQPQSNPAGQYGNVGGGGGVPGHHPGPLQYTSTPGSAFISSPFNQQSKPSPGGGPSRQGPGRWDHQRDDPRAGGGNLRGPNRDDPRSAGRFGPKQSRFSDANSERFQVPPKQQQQQQNSSQPTSFNRGGPDYSLGANQRGGLDPRKLSQTSTGHNDQHSVSEDRDRFHRDKDFRQDNRRVVDRESKQMDNNNQKNLERQNDIQHRRENRRDHRERDRSINRDRTSKRSISPTPSLASNSTAGGDQSNRRSESSSTSNLMSYLPKRRYEPCNIPKSSIIKNRYNSNELKSRFGSNTVHVPSDLKEILYDVENDFDLFDMPKPILYKIIVPDKKDSAHHHHQSQKENSKSSKSTDSKSNDKTMDNKQMQKDKDVSKEEKEKQSEQKHLQKSQEKESDGEKINEIGQKEENKNDNEQQLQDTADESELTIEMDQSQTNENISMTTEKEQVVDDENEQDKKEESSETEKQSIENQESIDMKKDQNNKNEIKENKMDVDDNDTDDHEHDKTKLKTNEMDESLKRKDGEKESKQLKKSIKVLGHKFNVKVLLISLPSLAEIYERLFGSEFPGPQSHGGGGGHKSTNRVPHLHKLFQLLVTRNSSDGYSLIGGKFQRDLDGYLNNGDPNLINTAIRIVWEQTGLNLSSCKQWRVFSTFIYNRDNSIDPSNAGYEVTKIYFPDIWSSFESIYLPMKNVTEETIDTDLKSTTNSQSINEEINQESDESSVKKSVEESKKEESMETKNDANVTKVRSKLSPMDRVCIKDVSNENKKEYVENLLQTMANLKVADLKNELEKFYIRFESRWKKEQLFQRLQQVCQESLRILSGDDDDNNDDKNGDHNVGGDLQNDLTIGKSEDINMTDDHYDENSNQTMDDDEDDDDSKLLPGQKRKLDDDSTNVADNNNDDDNVADNENESKSKETIVKKSKSEQESSNDLKTEESSSYKQHQQQLLDKNFTAIPSSIKVKAGSGQLPLSLVTLHSALNPHRFDQFELIIVSEFLRDSLTIHFARYILSSIVECIMQQKSIIPANTNTDANTSNIGRISTPINYVHLAFSYFEKGHCGYMVADDLNTLLQSTGFVQSRKTFQSLVSSLLSLANVNVSLSSLMNERIMYIFFPQPSQLITRQIYYPAISSKTNRNITTIGSIDDDNNESTLIIERNSIQYNVDELIKQSEQDQKIKARLQDTMNQTNKKIAYLENYVQELETKQKKMTAATGRQNDELCAIKRDRDQIKTKYEQMKKFCLKSMDDLNGLMKTLEGSTNDPTSQSSMDNTTLATASTTVVTETANGIK